MRRYVNQPAGQRFCTPRTQETAMRGLNATVAATADGLTSAPSSSAPRMLWPDDDAEKRVKSMTRHAVTVL